jgi:hypothetical protein
MLLLNNVPYGQQCALAVIAVYTVIINVSS